MGYQDSEQYRYIQDEFGRIWKPKSDQYMKSIMKYYRDPSRLPEMWNPKIPWFKPPKWYIFKWAYVISEITGTYQSGKKVFCYSHIELVLIKGGKRSFRKGPYYEQP